VRTGGDPKEQPSAKVKLTAAMQQGGQPADVAMDWSIFHAETDPQGKRQKVDWQFAANPEFALPQGRFLVSVKHGDVVAESEIEVEEGRQQTVLVNLDAGHVQLEATLSEGGQPVDKAMGWSILLAKADPQGGREKVAWQFATNPRFILPRGRYLVSVQCGDAVAESEIQIEAGQEQAVSVNLNAGRARLVAVLEEGGQPAQEAMDWKIFQAETDSEGNRKQVAHQYASSPVFILPAGGYVVDVAYQGKTVSHELSVEAGGSSQWTIVLE
jgi:hypothetical protein